MKNSKNTQTDSQDQEVKEIKANFFLERYIQWGFPQNPHQKTRTCARINTLKTAEKECISQLPKGVVFEKVPFLSSGYYVKSNFNLVSTAPYLQGWIYLQEAASQLPVQILNPMPGELIADLCSAPGSKTTQLAQWMKNQGQVISIDSNSQRLQKVQYNLERCGVENCLVIRKDVLYLSDLRLKFDKILLDAPCSGNFVTDIDWFDKRSLTGVEENARLQKQLIIAAYDCLKSGGTLVYSTCSLEKEENEDVVEHLLTTKPEAKIINITLDVAKSGLTKKTQGCARLWPSVSGTQGFFIAHISKS